MHSDANDAAVNTVAVAVAVSVAVAFAVAVAVADTFRMPVSLLKREPLLELCRLFLCGLALTVRHTATHIRRKQQSAVSVPLRFACETRHDCDWSVMTYYDLRLPKTCIKLMLWQSLCLAVNDDCSSLELRSAVDEMLLRRLLSHPGIAMLYFCVIVALIPTL